MSYALICPTLQCAPTIKRMADRFTQANAGSLHYVLKHTALGWIRTTAEYSLRNICLSQDCLTLILIGSKEVDSQRYTPGTFWYLPADESIQLANIPEANGLYLALTLSFSPELLNRAARMLTPPQKRAVPTKNELCKYYFALLAAIEYFMEMALAGQDETLLSMHLEQVLYLLWLQGLPILRPRHHVVAQVRAMVEANPSHHWDSRLVAGQLNMSERTLRRHLQDAGASLADLVRTSRLHVGLGLLQQAQVNVTEAALACGYESPSRFAARFREHFGLSPSQVGRGRGQWGALLSA